MSVNYRCKRCRKRVTRKRRIELYIQEKYKHCPECGGELKNVTKEERERTKARMCNCHTLGGLYSHPHRKGSYWCVHNQESWEEDEVEWRQRDLMEIMLKRVRRH